MLVTAINKNTKEIHRNIALSKINTNDYIINPSDSILSIPTQYWKIVDNEIQEMSNEEKLSVDIEQAKINKRAEVEEWWRVIEETGIIVDGTDFYLGIKSEDIAAITGSFVLASTSVNLNLVPNDTLFTLFDINRGAHLMTISEMISVLLKYGQTRVLLTKQYTDKLKAINEATSFEQLESIV